MRLALPLLLAASALLAWTPVPARAGTYEVVSCVAPGGQSSGYSGWESVSSDDSTVLGCTPSAFDLRSDPSGAGAVRWRAPAGLRLVGVRFNRGLQIVPGVDGPRVRFGRDGVWRTLLSPGGDPDAADGPANGWTPWIPLRGATEIGFRLGCGTDARLPCSAGSARLSVFGALLRLRDDAPPVVSNVRGPLTTIGDRPMTGRVSVSFDATDVGSGLYRVLTEIDGRREPGDWLDARSATPCRDRDDDESDPYEFGLDVPCPPAIAGAQATLWTHRMGDGLHDVSVFVEDASGNATRVLGPVRVRVGDPEPEPAPVPAAAPQAVPEEALAAPPPLPPVASPTPTPTPPPLPAVADPRANGYRATPDAQLTAHARTVGHGRPAVVSGSLLVPGGRKIIGARIEVEDPVRASRTIVVTDRLGRFVHRAPAGPSRTLRLTYRATPTAAPRRVAVALRVRARVRSSRRGGRVRGARAGAPRGS